MTRLDLFIIGFVCLVILFVALCARAGEPLYNFDVPLHGCAEKVTLVGCDYKATHCKTSRIKFHSATCLTVEAQ